jgi:hypothetical protein
MKSILIAMSVLSYSQYLPSPSYTPGDVRPGITASDLCPVAHTPNIRNVPESEKLKVYQTYGMLKPRTGKCDTKSGCEVDHLISLELGGSNDPKNLWPQSYDGPYNAHEKDKLENKLHSLVCLKIVPLDLAQKEISTDWISAYRKYVGNFTSEGEE